MYLDIERTLSKNEVLIIDDNKTSALVLSHILEVEGYHVRIAESGKQGLTAIRERIPQLIMLDIMMPDMDGFEVYRELKHQTKGRDVPVIFVSGVESVDDKARGFDMGAVDFISKPFEPSEVLARVKTHLSHFNTRKSLEFTNQELRRARDELERMNSELEERVYRRSIELEESNKALHVVEERFREFLEDSNILITMVDGEGRFNYVNHMAWKAFGITPEECIGLSAFTLIEESDRERTMQWFEDCIKDKVVNSAFENRQISRNGEIRYFFWNVNFHYDEKGNVKYINSIAQDITERKRHDNVQAAQLRIIDYASDSSIHDLLRKILDETELLTGSEIGFYHFVNDDQKTIELQTWSSNTMEKMCKTSGEELHYPIDKAGIWVECIYERKPMVYNDYPGLPHKKGLPDGHAPISRMVVVPVIRGDKIMAILGVGNKPSEYDQTDVKTIKQLADLAWETVFRKQREQEISNLRDYLAGIIDYMPSVLVGVDLNGRVTQWNRKAEQLTELKSSKALGKYLPDVFPSMAPEMEKISRSIKTREMIQEQKQPCHDTDGQCFHNITIYPLVTDDTDGAVIRLDDVTEQVKMEEMMVQSEKMLSVGGLAAGMAHEINNPLTGIILTAHNMSRRLIENPQSPANIKAAQELGVTLDSIIAYMNARGVPRMLKTIIQSGRRVADIVDNMLSFARKSEARVGDYSMTDLIDKTLELAAVDYDIKKHFDFKLIEIQREYEENLPHVPCEGAKIQQVLLNLLRNGAHAMMESGTQNPRFILRVHKEKNRQWIVIEIEDNGPGMDENTRKRVFEPFFTTKAVGVGTGLGLSVSYFIITENQGGEMCVASTPGGGANFIIRLPLQRSER